MQTVGFATSAKFPYEPLPLSSISVGGNVMADLSHTVENDLDEVVNVYETLYNRDAAKLFQAIKPDQFWRFFIDGINQKEENGWLGFEYREAGYLLAMMNAFLKISEPIEDLNNLIKNIHLISTSNVKNLNYDISSIEKKGCYRSLNGIHPLVTGCPIGTLTNSPKGLGEILEKINKVGSETFLPMLCIHYVDNSRESSFIIPDTVSSFGDFKSQHIDSRTQEMLLNILSTNEVLLIFLHLALDSNKTLLNSGVEVSKNVEREILVIIDQYKNSIKKASSNYEKFKVIIKFVQDCERFHPFFDANTRVFSMIIKNYLLIDNGLPPMICDTCPSRIVGYSYDELIPDYIECMRKTLDLAQGIEPYDVKINDILDKLNETEKNYFFEVREIAIKFQEACAFRSKQPKTSDLF